MATPITRSAPAANSDALADAQLLVDHPDRRVPLANVFNFRDLGGYPVGNGRTTQWGRMFRADGLHRLEGDDLDLIDGIGIRTVIDLRTSNEIADRGAFPVEQYPVAYHHLSIIDATWVETGVPEFEPTEQGGIDFLVWAYRDMLDTGAHRFAQAIATLAQPGNGPAVFHCAAGKDRTGILTMLILGGLGADREVIAEDFGLTRAGMDRMCAWLAEHNPEALQDMGERNPHMSGAHPDAMRQILTDLDEQHGGVRGYLSSIGVGDALLDDLAERLT
jgi:protein-tyrosine phosphatase